MGSYTTEINNLLAAVRRTPGWSVEYTKGDKWRVTAPSGAFVFIPPNATLARTVKNARAAVRRIGFTG